MRQVAEQPQHPGEQFLVSQLTGTHDICLDPADRRACQQAKTDQQGNLDAFHNAAQRIGWQPHPRLQIIFDNHRHALSVRGQPGHDAITRRI